MAKESGRLIERTTDAIKKKALKVASGPMSKTAGRNAKSSAAVSNRIGDIKAYDVKDSSLEMIRKSALEGKFSCTLRCPRSQRIKLINELRRKKYIVAVFGKTDSNSVDQIMVWWTGKTYAKKAIKQGDIVEKIEEVSRQIVGAAKEQLIALKTYKYVGFENPDMEVDDENLIEGISHLILALP